LAGAKLSSVGMLDFTSMASPEISVKEDATWMPLAGWGNVDRLIALLTQDA